LRVDNCRDCGSATLQNSRFGKLRRRRFQNRSCLRRRTSFHGLEGCKRHTVVGAGPKLVNGRNVRGCAVALVLFEIVEGEALVNASHDAVTRHLGANGCGSDDELDTVTFDNRCARMVRRCESWRHLPVIASGLRDTEPHEQKHKPCFRQLKC